MNITCSNCSKALKISDKIQKGLRQLGPGRVLRLTCPECQESIALDAGHLTTAIKQETVIVGSHVKPPMPPDIGWLKDGLFEEEEVVEDIPQALILAKPGEQRDLISKAVESIGYQTAFAESGKEAMERLQFINFASVILHENFEDGAMRSSSFHQFMRNMSMQKRRFIFYILISSEFSTLYDLEALSFSANLVVNNNEVPELLTILRKAIPRYEELFGSLMAEINAFSG
jgi:CheY-like chemotaxis protein